MIRFGNFLYILPFLILFALLFLACQLTARFGKKFSRRLILILLWSNFALHFLKQLNPYYYNRLPGSLFECTPLNFCAALIMMEPFIFLSKNKYMKDYAYYVGTLSSLAAYLFPGSPMTLDLSSVENFFEVVRYYSCHAPLLICGILMVRDGHHQIDYKRLWALPLIMVGVNLVIILDGLFFYAIGFPGFTQDWSYLIARDGPLSGAACFGPPMLTDKFLSPLYVIMLPGLQYYYNGAGEKCFTPGVWMLLPIYFVALVVGIPMSYPWQKHEMKCDLETIKQRIKMKIRAR